MTPGEYEPTAEAAGKRALKNLSLEYAHAAGNPRAAILLNDQFAEANNLTDRIAALRSMVNSVTPAKQDMSVEALQAWWKEPLLLNKWLQIQSTAASFAGEPPVIERVRELKQANFFSIRNPNNVYSLLLAFFTQNPAEFHRPDGSGYRLWVETVLELNQLNPQVAARVARALENWRRFTPKLAKLQFEALNAVYEHKDELSASVAEVIGKALHNPV